MGFIGGAFQGYTLGNIMSALFYQQALSAHPEIPAEIEESALVDGCSHFGAFWRIALPLVTPGLVATGVFCFIFAWTEFFFAVALTKSRAVPVSVYIVNFFGNLGVQWGQIGAMSILSMLPLFLLSFVVQRYLVRGLTLGAVK